jgi:hypothetical protein
MAAQNVPAAPVITASGGTPVVGGTMTIVSGGGTTALLLYRGGALVGTITSGYTFVAADCGIWGVYVIATGPGGTSGKSNTLVTDPNVIVGVTCSLKSDVVTASAGKVVTQVDQSGHGNSFTRTTATTGPPYPSEINGVLAPIYTDGLHEMSTTKTVADFFSATDAWICCVIWPSSIVPTAPATGQSIIGSTDGAINLTLWDSSGTKKVAMTSTDGVSAGAASQTIALSTTTAAGCHLVTARKTGTTLGISVDGAAETTSTTTVPATVPTSATLNLGYVSGAHTYAGQLGDIVTMAAAPSANIQATIEAFLSSRYDTVSRPAATSFTVLDAGDSLVFGQQSNVGGERVTYHALLRAAGWCTSSVGPFSAFGLHRGIGGERAHTVATTGIGAWSTLIAADTPTIGRLAWGVNDAVGDSRTSVQILADLATILAAGQAASPATKWIVASIVRPTSGASAPQLAEIDAVNAGGPAWAAANGATWEDRGTPTLSDGTHPDQTQTGYPYEGARTATVIAGLLAA